MSNNSNLTKRFSDAGVAALLRVATELPNVLEDLEGLAEFPPRELWEEITGQWKRLGMKWSQAAAAQILDVPEERVERWQRQKKLPPVVRRRVASLCELLALLVCGKLNTISDHDLRATVTILRGLPDEADDDTVENVLSILRSQFGDSAQGTSG